MATTKNLCAQIPIDLHERVSEERERLGKTTSEYIANLIQEYHAANKKDPVAAGSGVRSDLRHHGGWQRFPPFQNAGRIGEGTPCHGIRFSIPL